ncbi:hypothetical protein JI743_13685 [Sphingopyxis sp. DHUNG17]|uniref:GTA baseplate fiber-binding domain-containing protein n=1 Tax=Sphingopyxis jiangsuensis TaxID=2871171 RepID=UPI00191FB4E5|nr:phage tail protein [Sphingopyxis lutea]MBL0769857.1 hypothetical protein [Sphingopyxis lutea]
MATLVLTVVGGIVGGPVGAAIGAAVGQQVDAAIFKPKGREGPRLADLRVQASTYGQHVPMLFGTMRVAGSVIWATDLIEHRNKRGGGKGRPSTTEYSYTVSIAVALSSRPIRAIRRIWADGNLLRGASGTFKERCTFRWHGGGEDQPVDPLVASAVGLASASAFRGLAYAVFEDLELGAFGNRIPALTFEVEADAGDVDAGLVAAALTGEDGRVAGNWPFAGYAASGDGVRDALAPLFEADATRLVSAGAAWQLAPAEATGDPAPLAAYTEARRAGAADEAAERRRVPLASLPASIRLRHYEPARDYQLGQQAAAVAGGGVREERIDLPAALGAASARALAQKLAAAASDGRETLVVRGDLAALALPVGGLVAAAEGGIWRLAARTVRDGEIALELRRHAPVPTTPVAADPGQPVAAPDWPDADGVVRLFDLPSIDGQAATAPRILVAAAGSNDGWRGADGWFVAAPGSEPVALGTIRPAAALGALSAPLGAGSAWIFDAANGATAALVNPAMTLESIDDFALLGGANRAMIGDELIQFGDAEPLGPGLWRLSRLLRGRAGTEAVAHPAGTPFVLLDDTALLALPDALARFAESSDATLHWAARGAVDMTVEAVPGSAAALRPLAPVHGRIRTDGGGMVVEWIRRSRADTGWRDAVDLPPGEAAAAWRVTLDPPAPGVGPWSVSEPRLEIGAAAMAGVAPGTAIEVRQVGDFGLSLPLRMPLT